MLLSSLYAATTFLHGDIKRSLARTEDKGRAGVAKIMTLFAKGLHINHFGNLLLENALLPLLFFFFHFRQSPRPARYLSPVNPRPEEGDTRSFLVPLTFLLHKFAL